jgi:uncharacterized RDD family membrane protein YckC
MKCPKCEYLGFESSDRCRNCGYEFSLAPVPDAFDLPIDQSFAEPLIPSPDARAGERPGLNLDRVIGAAPDDLPLFASPQDDFDLQPALLRHPAPLPPVARPRAPLGVRRATPEIPRARIKTPRPADEMLFEAAPPPFLADVADASAAGGAPATAFSRILAALLDFSLLFALDAAVLYFTLRLCGLRVEEILQLPVVPLAAFFMLLNGGYFIAFTAVGGQSIGKMAAGIKVISREDSSVPIGRATLRTLAYVASALPLGAGFLPGVLGAERLALHDRLAHTRVVRPS